MAMDLRTFITSHPELFKECMQKPEITQKALSFVGGITTWAKRNSIPIKNVKISNPITGNRHYDVIFKLSKRG